MIGDPSGTSAERNLLDRETLEANLVGIRSQLERFLSFEGPNAAVMVNNLDWLAEFTLIDPFTLQVRVENTSTGVPDGFSNSDQLLTGLSWDFDPPGVAADTTITGGTVVIGPTSHSENFETGSYPAGSDVSGEWGYGNGGGSGALFNFITTLAAWWCRRMARIASSAWASPAQRCGWPSSRASSAANWPGRSSSGG